MCATCSWSANVYPLLEFQSVFLKLFKGPLLPWIHCGNFAQLKIVPWQITANQNIVFNKWTVPKERDKHAKPLRWTWAFKHYLSLVVPINRWISSLIILRVFELEANGDFDNRNIVWQLILLFYYCHFFSISSGLHSRAEFTMEEETL